VQAALMIEARGLAKSFGSGLGVSGIDLQVPAGTIVSLLGPNGAGKTTIVRMLATLLRPDAGWARVAGHDVVTQGRAVRRRIGLTGQALDRAYPGQFGPVIHDALAGRGTPFRLRFVVSLYAPSIRLAPWLWGMSWRFSDKRWGLALVRRTAFGAVRGRVAGAVSAHRPAAVVAFHGMATWPAVLARQHARPGAPVITVVTDLVTTHRSWREPAVDKIVVPSPAVGRNCRADGMTPGQWTEIGLPVTADFAAGPLPERERRALRRALGLNEDRFVVVVTGGAEGAGRIFRKATAIARRLDVSLVAICGHNDLLRRRLTRTAPRYGGRLTVLGFVGNMADWMRCADVVVTKAGPGTIAEAACCGAALVLTSHVPGQEEGNVEFVVAAGAGRWAPRLPELLTAVSELQHNPVALARMRAASARLARPDAAAAIARLVANLASPDLASADLGSADLSSAEPGRPECAGVGDRSEHARASI
jgi:1,2-diacylglycerol 3-beta-galactosyltransferase